MNGHDAYSTYISLKAHFKNPKYDFFKYGKLKPKGYNTRRDLPFFEKLSRKFKTESELVEYLVSQFRDNPDIWVGSVFDDDADDRHMARMRSIQAMRHNLETSTRTLAEQTGSKEAFGSMFVVPKDGRHPKFLSLLLQRKITEETFLCYNRLTGFMSRWDEKMRYDPIWEDMSLRLRKYEPFLNLETERIRNEIIGTVEKAFILETR
jgi:hypothetical protein